MQQILAGIEYIHKLKIAHRDIKPENIMYGNDKKVKLIDFGLAKHCENSGEKMHSIAGTPYFISPEVLNGNYGQECDIWSFGVVLYLMISGMYPFDGHERSEVFDLIKVGEFSFPKSYFKNISEECKDLIT